MTVDPASGFADVHAQVGRAFHVGDDLDRRHDGAEIDRHRSLKGDDPETRLLQLDGLDVVCVVAQDDVLRALEIAVEEDVGHPGHELGDAG